MGGSIAGDASRIFLVTGMGLKLSPVLSELLFCRFYFVASTDTKKWPNRYYVHCIEECQDYKDKGLDPEVFPMQM